MKVIFVTELLVQYVDAERDCLHEDFVCKAGARVITVPKGFITNYDSIPRLPLIFWLLGGRRHKGAVIHDYLYSEECPADLRALGRAWADAVYRDALRAQDVNMAAAMVAYLGVRAGGASHYQQTASIPVIVPADNGASGA